LIQQDKSSQLEELGVLSAAISGVVTKTLTPVADIRGSLCEIHRDEWVVGTRRPAQWDFVITKAHTLRGMHVHQFRFDHIVILNGRATIGLADLRRNGPTFRQSMTIDALGDVPMMILVPPGVAHGICAQTPLTYLYGLTTAWDGSDEDLGCRYNDPLLRINWPVEHPVLLPRDENLPDFLTMIRQFEDAGGVRIQDASPSQCP
jgi:dTDP-4-dehydrorhamnose 3,5-epimerase